MGRTHGAIAGTLAAAAAIALMLVLRLAASVPTLPETLQEWITLWLPLSFLDAYIGTFGESAKPLAFATLFVLLLALGGAIGFAFGGWWSGRGTGERQRTLEAVGLSALVYLLTLVLLRPQTGHPGLVLLALPYLCFGLVLPWLVGWLAAHVVLPPEEDEIPLLTTQRRRVVQGSALSLLAVSVGAGVWKVVYGPRRAGMGGVPGSHGAARGPDGLPPEVTPNADFYKVSKNFGDPAVRVADWKLQIGGLVGRPRSLSYEELAALPHRDQWQTLECISNDVGGSYISNALWTGVPLADLLAQAGGARPTAKRLVLRAADGYSDSLPLDKALQPTTLLTTTMNGEKLPVDHGFPARLLVPGVYGMKDVKWVTEIELVDDDFKGYWEERGWSDAAIVKTMSRIDVPQNGTLPAASATRIAGVAFAGDRGIAKVEVSDDAGATWRAAQLRAPRGPFTWLFWELPWQPAPGKYRIVVRATDGTGAMQAPERADTLPDGASGYHAVSATIT